LAPPSMKDLEERLRGRGTETEEKITQRLETAAKELDLIDNYDYIVINNEIENAVKDIKSIVTAEKCKLTRNSEFKNILKGVD